MMIKRVLLSLLMIGMSQFTTVEISLGQGPLTAKELLETTAFKAQSDDIQAGKIVIIKHPESEKASELTVAMAMRVPSTLKETVSTLQRQATGKDAQGILAAGEIPVSKTSDMQRFFSDAGFAPEEMAEVKKLMEIGPSEDFNFSLDEIAMIAKRAAPLKSQQQKDSICMQAMSDAMGDVLKGRLEAYFRRGLAGLDPYQIGPSKQIHPATELIDATEKLSIVKKRFPNYYHALRFFPESRSSTVAHQFFWVKHTESNRPLFVLKHWIMDVAPDYALITERRFYLNHSLNSLQVVIGCLPDGDSTLVVLLNQAFTEKVNVKVGGRIAKAIGYKQVEKNILPIFENLRAALSP